MKKLFYSLMLVTIFVCLLSIRNTFAYSMGTPYSWGVGDPNYNPSATIHTGTIDTSGLIMGDFLGRSSSNPNAGSYGDSGTSVGWDDAWVGGVGDPNTNGDALDGLWAQILSDGGWWDLGAEYNEVAVFTSQDHGPYPAEGVEYRIFGTNTLWDDASLGAQAILTDIYLDGWRIHNPAEDFNGNGWQSDDISGILRLDSSYRYIKLVAWDSTAPFDEPEIDAIAGVSSPVPEPATVLLLGSGLIGFAVSKKRKIS